MHDPGHNSSTTTAPPLEVKLKTGITEEDIPILAHINDVALEGDPFKQWRVLFTENSEYDSAVKALQEALSDPVYRVIKAVIADTSNPSGEKTIGFIHYLHAGYIELEKVDPFAPAPKQQPPSKEVSDTRDPSSNMPEALAEKATVVEKETEDAARADRLRRGEMKYVQSRNVYIAAIRGKRHMFIRRLMVLPEYQRKGIAGRLLRVVTDEADRLKIWCWLHSRPAGEKLYERLGFQTLAAFDMDEPELVCPVFKAMRRLPQPVAAS